jgi:SAM-dependent methyltransferase
VTSEEPISHWGADAVDPTSHSLPSLKAAFLLERAPRSGRVLEIGSGEGKILRTLASHNPRLQLDGCDVRMPATTPDVYTFHRMEKDAPLADATMDAVVLFDVVEHVPDPRHLLSEAARVLRREGHLIACVPVEGERLSFYEFFRRVLGDDTYVVTKEHIQAFTHRDIRALIGEWFDVTEIRYAYHAMGQLMDAAFFAAARADRLREFWWKDNVFYNEHKRSSGGGVGLLNRLLVAGNAIAWHESTLLSRTKTASACVLVDAVVRRRD